MLLQPRKRFGQNFLHDINSISRIITAIAPVPGQYLVEIGPGLGAITTGLLRIAGDLDVVELDRDLITPLAERCAGLGNLRIHNADALRFDFCALLQNKTCHNNQEQRYLRIVGNLPYNISTPLLFHILDQADCIDDLHFLLQKEVVARMVAEPGSKTYGRLSVMIQVRCAVQRLFDIGPGAFQPAPKVESSFVRLRPYRESPYAINDMSALAKLVAQAFSQRRKTLRNTLKPLLTEANIEACGLNATLRPEQLSVEDFIRLANAWSGSN